MHMSAYTKVTREGQATSKLKEEWELENEKGNGKGCTVKAKKGPGESEEP